MQEPSAEYEFFVLPTYSYFGDYQILFDLKSQISYKAGDNIVLIVMCLNKNKFLELMDDYPEARKFYFDRAWNRRVEFRRMQLRFRKRIESIDMDKIRHMASEPSLKSDDSSNVSDNSDIINSDDGNVGAKIRDLVDKNIKGKISKFYFFNQECIEELKYEDYCQDQLEEISDDEKLIDIAA